ncbi:MAG: DNA-directed DNA polymerase [Thermoprotei archaeon]
MPYWIIDINHEVVSRNNVKRDEIWLWCVNDDGERVLLVDGSFKPFLYVEVSVGVPIKELEENLRNTLSGFFERISIVEKKRLGKPIKVVEIVFKDSDFKDKALEKINSLRGVGNVYNSDIRPSLLYFITRDLKPSSWIDAEIIESLKITNIPYEIKEIRNPRIVENKQLPKLKEMYVMFFAFRKIGTPDPDEDPLAFIAVAFDNNEPFIIEADNDKEIINMLIKLVSENDPDLVIGWETNRWSFNYLSRRAEVNKVRLSLGRNGDVPRGGVYGHISLVGRIHVDVRDIAEGMPELKMKTLEEMSIHHGVWKGNVIENVELNDMWFSGERDKAKDYALKLISSLRDLWKLYFDYTVHLSSLVGYPMDYVLKASPGHRVDGYIVYHSMKLNEVIPRKVESAYERYRGAIVFTPSPGLHTNVAVLDFASMYPRIIAKYNISPDTLMQKEESSEAYVAPEVGHRFRVSPDGLYKSAILRLLEAREQIKRRIKELPEGPERKALESQERAIKVVANAMYGYVGWVSSRWYMKEVAEAITAWGRNTIVKAAELANKEFGLKVIYGDTDSLFVEYKGVDVDKLIDAIENELGMEIKLETIYKRVLFTEAKKRYAGLTIDDELDLTGFEVVRGDWCDYARRTQERILSVLLITGNVNQAVDVAREMIEAFKNEEFTIKDVVIWKSLDKPLSDYKARAPHVSIALQLSKKGWKFRVGDKIGYVVAKGQGPIYERAVFYDDAEKSIVDIDYYITNQIIPVALRVLEPLGITEDQLIKKAAKGGLDQFF